MYHLLFMGVVFFYGGMTFECIQIEGGQNSSAHKLRGTQFQYTELSVGATFECMEFTKDYRIFNCYNHEHFRLWYKY